METALNQNNGYGDFGALSRRYNRGRREVPDISIKYILRKIMRENPNILDIGCGTGISTRQLFRKGVIISGTDISVQMIREAKLRNNQQISYFVATANNQPFDNCQFDAVTIFSAFHWFATKATLTEAKRILKPAGLIFVVNKDEIGPFKNKIKEILSKHIGQIIPDSKKGYDPKSLLLSNGFRCVEEMAFKTVEEYDPLEAIEYTKTMSFWNMVPNYRRSDAIKELLAHFKHDAMMQNGKVWRNLEINVVSGMT